MLSRSVVASMNGLHFIPEQGVRAEPVTAEAQRRWHVTIVASIGYMHFDEHVEGVDAEDGGGGGGGKHGASVARVVRTGATGGRGMGGGSDHGKGRPKLERLATPGASLR